MDTQADAFVIVLAGLPGVGKTHLARRLAPELDAALLNRDDIRDGMFPGPYLDYSTEQNDVATAAMLRVLDYLLTKPRPRFVILDGKPFARQREIAAVSAHAKAHGAKLIIVHCVAPLSVVADRLQRGLVDPRNRRAGRTPEKAAHFSSIFEPIELPHIVIDTSRPADVALHDCVSHIIGYTSAAS